MKTEIIKRKNNKELVLVKGKFVPYKINEVLPEGTRVFYEHGMYNQHGEWSRSNQFIEIEDVDFFLKISPEDLNNQKFIDHHNFICLHPV